MHTIRLRHPWQCEIDDEGFLWSRKFNWPAELAPGEVVHLVIEPLAHATVIALNEMPLIALSQQPLDVTHLLRPHNLLQITCPGSSVADQCPFDVWLEIESRV